MLYTRSHSTEPLMISRSAFESWICWILCARGIGREFELDGKQLKQSAILAWSVLDSVVILLHMQNHPLKPRGSHMDGLMLDLFQWLMVVLYNNMPAIEVGVEFLQTKAY